MAAAQTAAKRSATRHATNPWQQQNAPLLQQGGKATRDEQAGKEEKQPDEGAHVFTIPPYFGPSTPIKYRNCIFYLFIFFFYRSLQT